MPCLLYARFVSKDIRAYPSAEVRDRKVLLFSESARLNAELCHNCMCVCVSQLHVRVCVCVQRRGSGSMNRPLLPHSIHVLPAPRLSEGLKCRLTAQKKEAPQSLAEPATGLLWVNRGIQATNVTRRRLWIPRRQDRLP